MKLGILGAGKIVRDFCEILGRLPIESVSILGRERSREKTEALAAENGMTCYWDYDELLKSDVDTVYVALPNHLHYAYTKQALQAGKNVILEKPATLNLQEFEELMALALEKDLILLEAVTLHYMPIYENIRADLDRVGDVKIVSLNYSQYSSRYDAFKAGEVLPAFDPAKGGGALMDINVYNIHFAVGLFGRPLSATYLANIVRGVDTSGILTMDYGEFKVVCVGAKDCGAPTGSFIQGDGGYIAIKQPVNQMQEYEIADLHGDVECKNFGADHRMIYEFEAFLRIIKEHDVETMKRMLEVSREVSAVLTDVR